MGTLLKVALEQSFAFLFAVAVVTFAQPTSSMGTVFLVVVSMAAFNAARVSYMWYRQRQTSKSFPNVSPDNGGRTRPSKVRKSRGGGSGSRD